MKYSTQSVQLILSVTVVSLILGYVSKDMTLNQKSIEIDNLKAELIQTRSLYNNLALEYNKEIQVESSEEQLIESTRETDSDIYNLPTEDVYEDLNQE